MAVSLKRINRAAVAEMRTHRKLFLIVQIILGIAAVLYGFENYSYNRYYGSTTYYEPWMACVLFVVAIGCGFFICSALFKDMHNVQTADVSLSLPMKSSERYAAKILSLFYIHILPLIVCSLAAFISTAAICSYDKKVLDTAVQFTLLLFLLALAAALFTDAVSIFCCCCGGTMAESIYFPIITAGCLSVAPSVFLYKMQYGFSGQSYLLSDFNQYLCCWTYSLILSAYDYSGAASFCINCAVNCLISLAVIFACVFIYKKRDARSVGTPIVFRLMFELMMFLGVFTVFITVVFEDMVHVGLVVALVAYLVINIVVSRAKINLRSIMVWLLKFVASIAVFVGIMAVGYVTDGFGAINYIPSDDELENTEISITLRNDYGNTYSRFESTDILNADQAKEIIKLVHSYNGTREKSVGDFFNILSRGNGYRSRYISDGYDMLPNDSSGFSIYINQYITDEDDVTYGNTVYEQIIALPSESVERLIADCDECGLLEEYSDMYLKD